MTIIDMTNVTKNFGDVTAVDNLDLKIKPGEIFGFLGSNGAGKSTTINMLLDFVRPSSGQISVLGYDPQTNGRKLREQVGVLPEGYGLFERLNGRKNVKFAIEMKKSDDDPDAILKRVGLADEAGRKVGGYSKGMRQRLALGMALVGKPELLILDEPSSGLDPNGAREMREIVLAESERGATVFFSSHILEHVEAICDRVAIMNEGTLVTVDALDQLRETSTTKLLVSVEDVIDTKFLYSIDGVTNVTISDKTFEITATDPRIKAKIITSIEESGATVTDIDVEKQSLNSVFADYTTHDQKFQAGSK